MEEERPSNKILYSPSQGPENFDTTEMVKTRMEELDRQRCMVVTIDELEEGVLVEPLEPSFDLKMYEFRGDEMDPVVFQAA